MSYCTTYIQYDTTDATVSSMEKLPSARCIESFMAESQGQ